MSQAVQARPQLSSLQAPVRDLLDDVGEELRRIIVSDFQMIEEVSEHLLFMQGKLFRPTLLLLSASVGGKPVSRKKMVPVATGTKRFESIPENTSVLF